MSILTPVMPVPHVPAPDDTEPAKRRPLLFFDRVKILVLIAAFFALVIAKERSDIPVISISDAISEQFRAKMWLLWVALAEALRQLHYLVSEQNGRYHQWWQRRVWGAWDTRMGRLNPWLRFRLGRLVKTLFLLSLAACYLGFLWGVSPVQAVVDAPSRLWDAAFSTASQLPFIFQILMILSLAVGQFAMIFWFMAKGGYDVLSPDEVQTRFKDIYGQDKVVDKVKENLVFLEKPAEIEAKGGHVPSGILLWGPPGTGKTMIAQAVAGETGRPFMFIEPGAFQAMFLGVGILKVRAVFRKLRKLALRHGGVIAFFDEADSLGRRGAIGGDGFRNPGFGPSAFETPHQCNGLHYVSHNTASGVQSTGLGSRREAEIAATASRRSGLKQVVMPGGMGGDTGTLQALLAEISGLEKPRGMLWKRVRKFMGMPSKRPPKYRILIMMATNQPESLDDALLRPGRIDRSYRVGFPNLDGRIRTYEGYLNKVRHEITPDQIGRIALMTPNGSGAKIKDIVNEGLIIALRDGRETVTWNDLLMARSQKTHGMSDDAHPVSLERHNVALHEASHAVAMKRLKRRETIDIATIERRGPIGGFVAPVPLEEEGFAWRYLQEEEIMTFLASLAGERHFYNGDNSVGVGGDLRASTMLVSQMVGSAAMGNHLVSRSTFGEGGEGGALRGPFMNEVDGYMKRLLERVSVLIADNERWVMAIAHALEQYHTISGEDIDAILNGTVGPQVDGRWYHTQEFVESYKRYHAAALEAHQHQTKFDAPLPLPNMAYARTGVGVGVGYTNGSMPPPPPPPPPTY